MNSPASCRPETPYQEQERERLTDPATQPLVGVPLSASRTDGLCIESPGTIYISRSRFIWVSCLHRSLASKGSNTVSISIKERQVKKAIFLRTKPSASSYSYEASHPSPSKRLLRIRQRVRECNVSIPVPNRVRQCVSALRVSCSLPLRHISHSHLCTAI